VHVGGDPDRIANAGMLDEDQEIGDLAFAATRGAAIASPLTTPSGRSAAMIFQVACELMSSRLSQDVCAGPRIAAADSSPP
jgi:hypothetical protein